MPAVEWMDYGRGRRGAGGGGSMVEEAWLAEKAMQTVARLDYGCEAFPMPILWFKRTCARATLLKRMNVE